MKHLVSLLTLTVLVVSSVGSQTASLYGQDRNAIGSNKNLRLPDILVKRADNGRLIFDRITTGDPCASSLPIAFGETINGALDASDCQLDDNSFADFYSFSGVQGRQVTIDMASAEFDTYLGLATESGSFTWEDDDGGPGTNARIVADLPETANYFIAANSLLPNTFGSYAVSLADTTPCSYTLTPNSQMVPASGGMFSFDVVTNDPDCAWTTTVFDSWITTNSSGNGSGVVEYSVDPSSSPNMRFGTIRVNNEIFTVQQQAIVCTLSFNPPGATVPAAGGQGSFDLTTQPTCPWSADGTGDVSTNSSGVGPGTVNYTVAANTGAARTVAVRVTVQTNSTNFLIDQAGLNCTYAVSDRDIYVNATATSGVLRVDTQPGCDWFATSNQAWLNLGSGQGVGTTDIVYSIDANSSGSERSAAISVTGVSSVFVMQGGPSYKIPFDLDGDSRTDISVFRPSAGQWWYLRSFDDDNRAFVFGNATDVPTPGDFTGDGKSDIAFWRESTGEWFVLQSEDSGFYSFPFGTSGDLPAVGDYDGDGKADPAVFRPSIGTFFILRSSDGQVQFVPFGVSGDKPIIADYDHDGKSDVAVHRPTLSEWWILKSSNQMVRAFQFGSPGDIPVPQDYSGDGSDDAALFRPTTGEWFVFTSESDSFFGFPFGTAGDIPVAGDYDRDGVADAAVFRPGENTWYLRRSNDGFRAVQFGVAGDLPLPRGN